MTRSGILQIGFTIVLCSCTSTDSSLVKQNIPERNFCRDLDGDKLGDPADCVARATRGYVPNKSDCNDYSMLLTSNCPDEVAEGYFHMGVLSRLQRESSGSVTLYNKIGKKLYREHALPLAARELYKVQNSALRLRRAINRLHPELSHLGVPEREALCSVVPFGSCANVTLVSFQPTISSTQLTSLMTNGYGFLFGEALTREDAGCLGERGALVEQTGLGIMGSTFEQVAGAVGNQACTDNPIAVAAGLGSMIERGATTYAEKYLLAKTHGARHHHDTPDKTAHEKYQMTHLGYGVLVLGGAAAGGGVGGAIGIAMSMYIDGELGDKYSGIAAESASLLQTEAALNLAREQQRQAQQAFIDAGCSSANSSSSSICTKLSADAKKAGDNTKAAQTAYVSKKNATSQEGKEDAAQVKENEKYWCESHPSGPRCETACSRDPYSDVCQKVCDTDPDSKGCEAAKTKAGLCENEPDDFSCPDTNFTGDSSKDGDCAADNPCCPSIGPLVSGEFCSSAVPKGLLQPNLLDERLVNKIDIVSFETIKTAIERINLVEIGNCGEGGELCRHIPPPKLSGSLSDICLYVNTKGPGPLRGPGKDLFQQCLGRANPDHEEDSGQQQCASGFQLLGKQVNYRGVCLAGRR